MSEPAWIPVGPAAVLDVGPEVAYQEASAAIGVSATTEATAQTVVTAPAFTADGSSQYLVEFFAPAATPATGAGSYTVFTLWLDGVCVGQIGTILGPGGASAPQVPVRSTRRVTPAAGARVYSVRVHSVPAGGNVFLDVGGTGKNVPGFIRVTKVPSAVAGLSGLVPPTAIGTALPASPVDGQEFYLTDSLAAPTYAWHLKYVAAKASNKWVPVAGEAIRYVPTDESRTLATYGDLATIGPSFTVPVAGIYTIETNCFGNAPGGWYGYVSFDIGATPAAVADEAFVNGQGQVGRNMQKTLAAGTALVMKYHADGSHACFFKDRTLRVAPVAVGG